MKDFFHHNFIMLRIFAAAAVLCAASARSQQQQQQQVTSDPAALRLIPGDAVDIAVYRHTDMGGKFLIGEDGGVSLPLIGKVALKGLTTGQAKERIESLLGDGWLRKPRVTVNVTGFKKRSFTITGEVNGGNTFVIERNRTVSVLEALGMARGFNTVANRKTVVLKRGSKSYEINIREITRNPKLDVRIEDGDVIIVGRSLF